jgi:hypothetical protein
MSPLFGYDNLCRCIPQDIDSPSVVPNPIERFALHNSSGKLRTIEFSVAEHCITNYGVRYKIVCKHDLDLTVFIPERNFNDLCDIKTAVER